MPSSTASEAHLAGLADHLDAHQEAILSLWRDAVSADPDLSAPSSLSRIQFRDHVPRVLACFSEALRTARSGSPPDVDHQAGAHGTARWQQGYNLTELMREWGHLQMCLVDQLERYAELHPEVNLATMSEARRLLARLCSEAVNQSTARFVEMRQAEAAAQVRDLELALHDRRAERRQADLVRAAAHDLRGNLGIVLSAASVLARDDVSAAARSRLFDMVKRAVASQQSLLGSLNDLAHLQAGQERREIAPFDAAELLRDLCTVTQPRALERGLFLAFEGPDALPVEGDVLRVRRIAQNLLLNALEYTEAGGVTVRCEGRPDPDADRWTLSVLDTGPGFEAGPSGPLAGVLKEATFEARITERDLSGGPTPPPDSEPIRETGASHRRGEGIGLAIVKRLCELLDATLEFESRPGVGSVFRVLFPRRYG